MHNMDSIDKILASIGEEEKDIFDLPEGHFGRFESRISHSRGVRTIHALSCVSIAAVAAIVALFVIFHVSTSKLKDYDNLDYFAGVTQTPEAVYNSYLAQISEVQKTIESRPDASYWMDTFEQIADENVSLLSTLPEELEINEAYRIVIDHYSMLLKDVYDFQEVILGL